MRVLLVEDDDDLRSVLAGMLRARCHVEVTEAASGNRAIALFREGHAFDLVVSDYAMLDGSGGKLFEFLEESGSRIPFMIFSSLSLKDMPEFAGRKIAGFFRKPDGFRPLLAAVESACASIPGKEELDSSRLEIFMPVELSTAAKVSPLVCPLYVRLSDRKYVKVMNLGDSFGAEEVMRFGERKRLDALHIRTDDCPAFACALARNHVTVSEVARDLQSPEDIQRLADAVSDAQVREDLSTIAMMMKVSKLVPPSAQQAVSAVAKLLDNVSSHFKRLGFSAEVQAQVKATTLLATESLLGSTKGVREAMAIYARPAESFRSNHSVHLACMSCAIAHQLSWGTEVNRYKLALASFLHDLTLPDDRTARISETWKRPGAPVPLLSGTELMAVESHPEEIVRLVRLAGEILAYDIDVVLREHHERPDGSGYPNGLTAAKINPVACVLIVAHDLTDYLMSGEPDPTLEKFLAKRAAEYGAGTFRKIAAALRSLEPVTED